MQREFDSYHIVMAHYQRQFKVMPGLRPTFKAEDCINDIRRYLNRIGLYVSAHEWPTFIERFCIFNIDGDISLDRKKLLMHKELSDKHAAQLLGEELQHHPEVLKKLKMILKSETRAKAKRVTPIRRPSALENFWAS